MAHAFPGIGSVEHSRKILLEEIGPTADLTFIRGYGNIGDELIWAGTRQLLAGHVYREIGIEELSASSGGTALLCGGGAFSRKYNEFMPEALSIAELRFDRVIVLPSSFEVEEDRVRDVLQRTRATVFAREHQSFVRIAGLCRARLAHDCAFFYDYSRYSTPGTGTLQAFRTDLERRSHGDLPVGNIDISATCSTLEAWLSAIAQHEIVYTDRAHVMIAAALMGKEVHYKSNSYFKVDAIADAWLHGLNVHRMPEAPTAVDTLCPPEPPIAETTRERLRALALRTPAPAENDREITRVTAVILSRDRPATVGRAIDSVLATRLPVRVLVLDQNSGQPTRELLQAKSADGRIDLRLTNRNLLCSGGRKHAVELVDTEFVLFLDDDAELMPGALEHLVADLDHHPDATAVTAFVVYADGTLYHFGGWVEQSHETVRFELHGHRRPFDDPNLADTGPSGWVPGTVALIRTRVFDDVPIDDRISYFEDNDWSLRLDARWPRSFRRCREAIVMHAIPREPPRGASFIARARLVKDLANHGQFLHTHGVVLVDELARAIPELVQPGGHLDLAATRLLLEIVMARGTDWTLMNWMNGGLDTLFDVVRLQAMATSQQEIAARQQELATKQHELAVRQQEIAADQQRVDSERQANASGLEALAAKQAMDAERLAWLEQRNAALALIEHGNWWRLRSRLMPLRPAALTVLQLARKLGGDG